MSLHLPYASWIGARRAMPALLIKGRVPPAAWMRLVAIVVVWAPTVELLAAQELATNEPQVEVLPRGDVFDPLIADPKEPEFLASYLWVRSAIRDTRVAAVGFGESFGIVRWPGASGTQRLQAGDGSRHEDTIPTV